MLSGTLGTSLSRNLYQEKESQELVLVIFQKKEKELQELVMVVPHKIKWIFNTASSFNKLWNYENYENEPRFNGVFSRDNLPKK